MNTFARGARQFVVQEAFETTFMLWHHFQQKRKQVNYKVIFTIPPPPGIAKKRKKYLQARIVHG